jgi:hypothetical protein
MRTHPKVAAFALRKSPCKHVRSFEHSRKPQNTTTHQGLQAIHTFNLPTRLPEDPLKVTGFTNRLAQEACFLPASQAEAQTNGSLSRFISAADSE